MLCLLTNDIFSHGQLICCHSNLDLLDNVLFTHCEQAWQAEEVGHFQQLSWVIHRNGRPLPSVQKLQNRQEAIRVGKRQLHLVGKEMGGA